MQLFSNVEGREREETEEGEREGENHLAKVAKFSNWWIWVSGVGSSTLYGIGIIFSIVL